MNSGSSQILLDDKGYIHRIHELIPNHHFGVEWASGKGALTGGILERWNYTLGIEIEHSFCKFLRKKFSSDKLGIIRTDIMNYPLPDRDHRYPLVGNLPYHITGPLLMRILENNEKINSFIGLVQWEVAKKLVAEPGESNYGSISLLFRRVGELKLEFEVPQEAFSPTPDVDSGLINFEFSKNLTMNEQVQRIARRCFRYPRKTLINNLSESTVQKKFWNQKFKSLNWNRKRRPHTLRPDQFNRILKLWNHRPSS